MSRKRYIRYLVTKQLPNNNINEDRLNQEMKEYLLKVFPNSGEIIYAVWNIGCAPSTNKAHIHLYIEFKNAHSYNRLKEVFKGANIQIRSEVQPLTLHDYVIKQDEGEENYIGDYKLVKNKRQKKKKKNTNEVIKELVSTSDSYEECVRKNPVCAQKNRDSIKLLLDEKKTNKFRSECKKDKAETGEEIYFFEKYVAYIEVPYGLDILQEFKYKFGNDISFLKAVRGKIERYDDYEYTSVMIIQTGTQEISFEDIVDLSSKVVKKLPCRYSNKNNLAKKIIIVSSEPFPYEFNNDNVRKTFTGGVWSMWMKDEKLFGKCVHKGKNKELPVSENRITIVRAY